MGRRLGQHFLSNQLALTKIAKALELKSRDIVIEVGPGHGELTEKILEERKDVELFLVEKDIVLGEALKEKFNKDKKIHLILNDVRSFVSDKNIQSLTKKKNYKIVGNIPYYLTGYLLRLIGHLKNKPSCAVLTIQKEVAERIAAKEGEMNRLAASIQFWAEPEYLFSISKKDFIPPPQVDSATIRLKARKLGGEKKFESEYYKFISILFAQPRKTILNNLIFGLKKSRGDLILACEEAKILPDLRPQDLSLAQIMRLAKIVL